MKFPSLEIIYYVACSVDRFIARVDGSVDWLNPYQTEEDDFGYAKFYASCDSLIMGSHTYEVALSFGEWRSKDKPSRVFSSRELPVVHESITVTNEAPGAVVEEMVGAGLKRAWMMGGGNLAGSFLDAGLLSELRIFVIPVLLGGGIPMFAGVADLRTLKLTKTQTFSSDVVELRYKAE